MFKKVLLAGLLGAVAMMLFSFVVNGIFGFHSRLNMKRLASERELYERLKQEITQPGHYICNPALNAEGRFPEQEPVFTIVASGFTHGRAGASALKDLLAAFLGSLVATGLLAMASPQVLASYPRKVIFFGLIGVLFGLLTGWRSDYPALEGLQKAVYEVAYWTATGLVVAACLWPSHHRPGADQQPA